VENKWTVSGLGNDNPSWRPRYHIELREHTHRECWDSHLASYPGLLEHRQQNHCLPDRKNGKNLVSLKEKNF
jgi:hypothetical protein